MSSIIPKDTEFILLSEEQTFGEEAIEAVASTGVVAFFTDYALITGTDPKSAVGTDDTGTPATGPGMWFLSSEAGYGDVASVSREGRPSVAYVGASGGIRPAASLIGSSSETLSEKTLGEYPQSAVERSLARTLESRFAAGTLVRTGKRYDEEYDEFSLEDGKYIRVTNPADEARVLSDGKRYETGEAAWIRVEPLTWLIDRKTGLMVSRHIVAFADEYSSGREYHGDFKNTGVYRFLNRTFAKDIVPSEIREMTEEEKKEFEQKAREEADRRNPYRLTFGEASEEEIIRGAIESDVAVFLHGPSSEGKSARVKQIDPTCEIIYLRNATPDSLNGRSVYNQSTGEMIDIPPTWYKKVKARCEEEPDRLHVVFFDEINNALPSIQGMAFNIVLDREVNGIWKLPENARVVAAGNDMQESLAANQIAAPFFNRFAHVYINTTTEKWLNWARENSIHPAIYAFIAYRQGETLRSEYDGKKPNADPRKWEMASRMLYTTSRPEMLRSLVGEEIADEFVQFCSQPVITLERVLNEDYTEEDISSMNTSERYATVMGLSQADESQLPKVRGFVKKLGAEFCGLFDSMWVQGSEVRREALSDLIVDEAE